MRLTFALTAAMFLCVGVATAAPPTIVQLGADLKAKDEAVKLKALEALAERAAEAIPLTPAIAERLADTAPAVRIAAARALGAIGPAARAAAPQLARAVADKEVAVRRAAMQALGSIRPGPNVMVPLVADLLADGDEAVRARAMASLAEAGERALPFLSKALTNEKTRTFALLVLQEIGPTAKGLTPQIVKLLDDSNPLVRREAVMTLGAIGPGAAAAVAPLAKLLGDDLLATPATYALASIGGVPADALAKIEANAKSDKKMLAAVSSFALAKLRPNDKAQLQRTTEQLASLLTDKDPLVRIAAARGLGQLKPGPQLTLPAIEKALDAADADGVAAAVETLSSMGPAAVPGLVKALKHEKVRYFAVEVLAKLGPAAAAAVPALIPLLDDKSERVRIETAMALGNIGAGAKDALETIIGRFEKQQGPEAYALTFALGHIGPAAPDKVEPALLKAVEAEDASHALLAAWALSKVSPKKPACAAKAVPVLIKGLGDEAPMFRRGAAESLGSFGTLARAAAPNLRKALQDPDASVRQAATTALRAIGG